jgi:hypothetical protein
MQRIRVSALVIEHFWLQQLVLGPKLSPSYIAAVTSIPNFKKN